MIFRKKESEELARSKELPTFAVKMLSFLISVCYEDRSYFISA